jgi:RNA polymerase sigma factor (sigma-70 family)
MDSSQRPPSSSRNLSTRWRCRPGRGLLNAESFCKTTKRRRDHQPLTIEQQQLAARYLPLARSLAKPLKLIFTQWKDEFESAACLALVEAARSFDPSRNIQFATFARFRIRGALVDVGRGMGLSGWESDPENAPGVVTLTPYNEEHGTVLVAFNPPPIGTEFEDIDAVEHLLRKLPKKHASVCRMQYLYGKTQMEIAAVLGCSQAEVTRLHKKSLELLSDPYDAEGRFNQRTWKRRRVAVKPGTGQTEGAGSTPVVA